MHPVAREARMGVAVDETGDRSEAPAVDLVHVGEIGRQIAHRADHLHLAVAAEDEGVLDDLHVAEAVPPQRAAVPARRRDLRQVADEESGHRSAAGWASDGLPPLPADVLLRGTLGRSSPPSCAASSASG